MRDRPYINFGSYELFDFFNMYKNDIEIVKDIAYEVSFRNRMPKEERSKIIEHLINCFDVTNAEPPYKPDFDFPTIHLHETRSTQRSLLNYPSWQEIGLLKASGYTVGKTNGISPIERRKILNFIFLKDDLSDIDDYNYAQEWGNPKTEKRLKKLADCISCFANQALRNPYDMSSAISDWSYDLDYLKTKFYDDWAGFPWPEIESEC